MPRAVLVQATASVFRLGSHTTSSQVKGLALSHGNYSADSSSEWVLLRTILLVSTELSEAIGLWKNSTVTMKRWNRLIIQDSKTNRFKKNCVAFQLVFTKNKKLR
jgi:hypothetical protein